MDRLSRHELKEDALRTAFEDYEKFIKEHAQDIALAAVLVLAAGGAALGFRFYSDRREAAANTALGEALETFHAYVGAPAQFAAASQLTFPTAQEKYQKALGEFAEVRQAKGLGKYLPETKAARLAHFYSGLCQARLGDDVAAMKTFEQASRDRDADIAALAKLALGGELAKIGKTAEAAKLFQDLADHPTGSVPKATALLALADSYRSTQRAQARQAVERAEKEFASAPTLANEIRQQAGELQK